MFKIEFDRSPIVIEVNGDRWDAYAQHDPPNYRDKQLLALLKRRGGINHTVPDGRYHYNFKWTPLFNVEVSLTKIEE